MGVRLPPPSRTRNDMRFACRFSLLSIFLATMIFLLAQVVGCDSEGSGSIDGIELGRNLRLHLENIARQDVGFDAERLTQVRVLFNDPPQGLDSLRIYTAHANVDDMGTMDLRIALFPLPNDVEGAYLAVAVGSDGVVYRTRLWGLPDPESAWEHLWRQFEYRQTRTVLDLSSVPADSVVDRFWTDLQADASQEGRTLQALYRHRLQMLNVSYLIRRTMTLTGNGEVPEPAWFQQYIKDFGQLGSDADALKPLLGEQATQQYMAVTKEAQLLLEPLVSHAREQDVGKVRREIRALYRRICTACHGIEDHALGEGKLQSALFREIKKLGVRWDLYRVGYDLWAAPGAEEKSQEVASTIKAILLLLER